MPIAEREAGTGRSVLEKRSHRQVLGTVADLTDRRYPEPGRRELGTIETSEPGSPMTTHSFTLILAGVDATMPEMAEALYEAGCDDSTPGSRCGVVMVHFDREAESLGDAIGSAIKDVEKAGYKVAKVEVEEPATVG
jgi:hypothetical protein